MISNFLTLPAVEKDVASLLTSISKRWVGRKKCVSTGRRMYFLSAINHASEYNHWLEKERRYVL
jgi:hypothetical protein